MRMFRITSLLCGAVTLAWAYRHHNDPLLTLEPTTVSAVDHAGQRLPGVLSPPVERAGLVRSAMGKEEIFFSPFQNLEQVDVGLIQQAHTSIKVAMYAFTDRRIAAALERQAAHGVQVWVYRDGDQFEQERMRASGVAEMLAGHPNIHVRVKGTNELMHHKIMLIDDAILRDGSGNWSVSAARYQDNQITLTQNGSQIAAFNRDFEAMWDRKDNLVVQ